MKTNILLFTIGLCQLLANMAFAQSSNWMPTNGPLGADATAFYIDGNGNYWLGTGSSGGVYRSTDKGQSWEPFNGGIGTAHVSWIGVINGQLHIEVADETAIISGKSKHPFRMYTFQGGKYWGKVADEKNEALVKAAYESTRIRYEMMQQAYPHKLNSYNLSTDKEGFINQNHLVGEERVWLLRGAVQLRKVRGIDLPSDVYALRGWNFYLNENNELVVLGKTNVYVLKNKTFVPMGKQGLVATDVNHVTQAPDKTVYAISNYRDLYCYQNKEWKLLFNSRKQGAATSIEQSPRMNLHPDGQIVTVLAGNIYSLKGGAAEQLVARKTLVDTQSLEAFHKVMADLNQRLDTLDVYFSSAAYDRQGKLWAYGEVGGWGMLMQISSEGEVTTMHREQNDAFGKGAFLAVNPQSGDLWFFSGLYAQWLDQPAVKLPFHLGYFTGHYGDLVAFSPEGRMAFPVLKNTWASNEFEELVVVETQDTSYTATSYKVPLNNVTCLGFDSQGSLYAGTGFSVANPNDICSWGMSGAANGLFVLHAEGWRRVENDINPWILSLMYGTDGLWVGTSGSGLYRRTTSTQGQWPAIAYIKENGKEGASYNGKELFATKYRSVISYEDYYKIHGHERSHPYLPELAPTKLFALQEMNGSWRLGNLEGFTTEESFQGFFHTGYGGLLAYRISNQEKDTRAHWKIALDGLKMKPLPYAKIYAFEKGYIVQLHDGTYRICNDKLGSISRQPFEAFKQVNNRIYLMAGSQSEVWDIVNWKRMSNLPFVETGAILSYYMQVIDENGGSGLLNTKTGNMVFLSRFDSLSVLGDLWLTHSNGKTGLYHAISEDWTSEADEKWDVPMEYELLGTAVEDHKSGPFDFDSIEEDSLLLSAAILKKDGKVGVYAAYMRKWMLPSNYTNIQYLGNYLFLAENQGKQGIYSSKSRSWLIECVYENIQYVMPKKAVYAYFILKQGDLYGLFSPAEKVAIEPAYHSIKVVKDDHGQEVFHLMINKNKRNPEIHKPKRTGDEMETDY